MYVEFSKGFTGLLIGAFDGLDELEIVGALRTGACVKATGTSDTGGNAGFEVGLDLILSMM